MSTNLWQTIRVRPASELSSINIWFATATTFLVSTLIFASLINQLKSLLLLCIRSRLIGGSYRFYSLILSTELLLEYSPDDLTSSTYYCPPSSSYPPPLPLLLFPSGSSYSSFLYSGVKNFARYKLYIFLSFSYIMFMTLLYSANILSTAFMSGSSGSFPFSSAKMNSCIFEHSKGRAAPITTSVKGSFLSDCARERCCWTTDWLLF